MSIFNGKRFFRRIVTGELKEKIVESDRCIIQRTHMDGRRSFAYFESWEAFRSWYVRLDEDSRTFCEVIRKGPQKFRIDVDCKEKVDKNFLLRTILEGFVRALTVVTKTETEVLIYESELNLNSKISFHLVATGIFSTSEGCLEIARLTAQLSGEFGRFVDLSIYKSLQCFRIEGSKKVEPGKGRYKRLICISIGIYQYQIDTEIISRRFLDGLITNIKECRNVIIPDIPAMAASAGLVGLAGLISKSYPKDNYTRYVSTCEKCGSVEIVGICDKQWFLCFLCRGSTRTST
jgi:hypothetical protein